MATRLVFFLSRATPLSRWAKLGILERETAVYRQLSQQIDSLSILTSGGKEELAFQEQLPNIQILYNRWKLSPNVYSILAPILHRQALRQATVYKTNQLDGAWTAVLAAKLHHRPVIVRAGYLWSNNFIRQKGKSLKATLIHRLEHFSFKHADHVVVTTKAMADYVVQKHRISSHKTTIIPNYVDTTVFRPLPFVKKIRGRICFVGRLTAVKNLDLLLTAIAPLKDVSLVLIGSGEQQDELKALAHQHHIDVHFLGRIKNHELPTEINKADIFVLPSKFEGHPKALIEAMGCGTAVIGTDVEGINTVIKHNETGLLCQPDASHLRQTIADLLASPEQRTILGKKAEQYVQIHFSLDVILEAELSVLKNTQQQK